MATPRAHEKPSALDENRVVLVHIQVRDEDVPDLDVEEAVKAFSSQSLATVRCSRYELALVFCCIADAVAFALDCLTSTLGPSIRLGVRAQEVDRTFRLQTWDLASAKKLATEATFGGVALCWESYSASIDFFEGSEWFVALYEDASDQVDIAAVSRMPLLGTGAFSTFAGLSPAFA